MRCLNNNYASYVTSLNNTRLDPTGMDSIRQWSYQTCSQFGYCRLRFTQKRKRNVLALDSLRCHSRGTLQIRSSKLKTLIPKLFVRVDTPALLLHFHKHVWSTESSSCLVYWKDPLVHWPLEHMQAGMARNLLQLISPSDLFFLETTKTSQQN